MGRPNWLRSTAYRRATSKAASCWPTACQATARRVTFRTLFVSRKLFAWASLKKSGTTTLSSVMSAFWTVRSEILFSILVAL
ncbi:hypothetical protein D9M68_946900 [compost metagenome]